MFSTKCKFIEHVLVADVLPTDFVFKRILTILNPCNTGENFILYNNKKIKGGSSRCRPRALSPLLLTLLRQGETFQVSEVISQIHTSLGEFYVYNLIVCCPLAILKLIYSDYKKSHNC